MDQSERFSLGDLVRARERDWVVVSRDSSALSLRPLVGSEEEIETIFPEIEIGGVESAEFGAPKGVRQGGSAAARLLRDALKLSLRRGAGPFRGAGRINFQPRAYQMAPLMMALRLDPVRLLIGDDVGVGKTIEAGLILRELLDRGELRRFTVLCPPALVDQWTRELQQKFSIQATAVTASGARWLERNLPVGQSVFREHPFTVVSVDFIKHPKRVHDFMMACPRMVVIDEAHGAVSSESASVQTHSQQRYNLVRKLADDPERSLILLTATPHSGKDAAFDRLLGLVSKEFGSFSTFNSSERRRIRPRMAQHFIQRHRKDIEAWRDEPTLFPNHLEAEVEYVLSGPYEDFYTEVLDSCGDLGGEGGAPSSLAWYALSLMRCVGSSAAAAAKALQNRTSQTAMAVEVGDSEEHRTVGGEVQVDDLEPLAAVRSPSASRLRQRALELAGIPRLDPKFLAIRDILRALTHDRFSPVIFCKYQATAEWLAAALTRAFPKHAVEFVTGRFSRTEREGRVERLGSQSNRILVTTDCLSEGINLQHWFDAVIHYDLSWRPTRHQQRSGRVDRFGQANRDVRTVTMYAKNNPVDCAVLEVISRKARAIEQRTGVRVPLPDSFAGLTQKIILKALREARENRQRYLDFGMAPGTDGEALDPDWEDAAERIGRSRTIFAHSSLKADDVSKEWNLQQAALGGEEDTRRFVSTAMARLNAPLSPLGTAAYSAPLHLVPIRVRERFEAAGLISPGLKKAIRISFVARPPKGCVAVHRAHALPSVLAETFMERAMDHLASEEDLSTLPRTGAWECNGVDEVTWLALLRIRHRLRSRGKYGPNFAMAEEAGGIAISAKDRKCLCSGHDAFRLLDHDTGDLLAVIRQAEIVRAVDALPSIWSILDVYAAERASTLAADHLRVRQTLGSKGSVHVEAATPVDVIGLYVLMPVL